jgi:hypothetical protein
MPIPFRPIARLLARTVRPSPKVDISSVQSFLRMMDHQEQQGVLITVNHYSAPDFHAWWFAILISAIVPANIHWVVTSGWTNSGWLTGFTHWLFPRGARLLGFTPIPAMPPEPAETELRAVAVRKVLNYANHTPHAVVGMAPEGGDQPGGMLGTLPAGVGRFMQLLSQSCPNIIPVGVWKEDGCIQLNLGSQYNLDVQAGLSAHERDCVVGDIIMRHIAVLLPESLRGEYR